MFSLMAVKSQPEWHGFHNLAISPRTKRQWVCLTCQVLFAISRNSTCAGAVPAEKGHNISRCWWDTTVSASDTCSSINMRRNYRHFLPETVKLFIFKSTKWLKSLFFKKSEWVLPLTLQNWMCFMSFASQIWILHFFFLLGKGNWKKITLNKFASIQGNAPRALRNLLLIGL